MIKVENLKKHFDNLEVLRGIDEHIAQGEVVVVIGPSGSGKSTFLRCLNLLETVTEGRVCVDDECINDPKVDVNKIRQKMGMVFQQFNLFPHLTIMENITLAPVLLKKMTKEEAKKRGQELLKRVNLSEKADAYPVQLSGGQKQRVAIARAMVNNPKILLADEPTGALDSKSGQQIMELFEQLNEEGVTIVMITHDRNIASKAKRIVHIIDGMITEEGAEPDSGSYEEDVRPAGSGDELGSLPEAGKDEDSLKEGVGLQREGTEPGSSLPEEKIGPGSSLHPESAGSGSVLSEDAEESGFQDSEGKKGGRHKKRGASFWKKHGKEEKHG